MAGPDKWTFNIQRRFDAERAERSGLPSKLEPQPVAHLTVAWVTPDEQIRIHQAVIHQQRLEQAGRLRLN